MKIPAAVGQNAKELQKTKSCWRRRRQRRKLSRKKMQVPLSKTRMTWVWPKMLSETDREYWIPTRSKNCQHSDTKVSKSTHFYEGETTPRTCRNSYFQTIHKLTKKRYARNRLCYSEGKGKFFCFPCKVMACLGLESQNKLVGVGFNVWKNANNLIRRYEESNSHQQHLIELLMRKRSVGCVYFQLAGQIEKEKNTGVLF